MKRLSCEVEDDVVGVVCTPGMHWVPGVVVMSEMTFVVVRLNVTNEIVVGDAK